jgi:5-methylthioribose kinase
MDPRFVRAMPGAMLLDADKPHRLQAYLRKLGWLGADEVIKRLAKAGEGNMNLVLRVETGARTLIVKQSRPWVERYPTLDAPADRALVEARFYDVVAGSHAIASRMPRLLGVDPTSRLLLLQDLGPAADMSDAYTSHPLTPPEIEALLGWLAALHDLEPPRDNTLTNHAMRALNHLHIFDLPLRPPATDDGAAWLRSDLAYVAAVRTLGERYLADGPTLVHGDFYPGSWVRTERGPMVLDPEFGHLGEPAFDVGVAVAHLTLAGAGDALSQALQAYRRSVNVELVRGFAGAELMRRLLGVARLPLQAEAAQLRAWLELSRSWVLG